MPITQSSAMDLSATVTISTMTEHDLLEVVDIEEHSNLSRWGWAAYYAELQGNNRKLMLVARVDRPLQQLKTDHIAGYIAARMAAGELHINNVAVRPEYRRQGIGGDLLNRVLQEGRNLNATAAFLEVRAGNSRAKALYEKCGLVEVGRRPNYYAGPVEDAIIMSVGLQRSA